MREEANSVSHDFPLLQSQIKQFKDEALKERATRTQYEATIVQYQENIQAMRAEIEKVLKEKAKLELGEKRAQETLKEGDALRGKVVGLMSENKSLAKRVEELEELREELEVVRQNKALGEEIVKLRERVVQLEGNNIRLKAGRSILAGGDGKIDDIQAWAAVQTSSTKTFVTIAGALSTPPRPSPPKPQRIQAATSSSSRTAAPQGQNTDPIDISDDEAASQTNDEVVFLGENSILATPENFQIASPSMERHSPYVSSTQNIGASTASATEIFFNTGSGQIMREPPAPNSAPPPPPVTSATGSTADSIIAPGMGHPQPPAPPAKA